MFESRFESGNLRRAIKVWASGFEYDLILKPDLYTSKHTQYVLPFFFVLFWFWHFDEHIVVVAIGFFFDWFLVFVHFHKPEPFV